MTVVVYSVRHTGTHFIWHFIKGLLAPDDDKLKPLADIGPVKFMHVADHDPQPDWDIVMPLRDPLASMTSAAKRGKRSVLAKDWVKASKVRAAPGRRLLYIPLDAKTARMSRTEAFYRLAIMLGRNDALAYCRDFVAKWDEIAAQSNHIDGDDEPRIDDVADLKAVEHELRPWLKLAGYTRLDWWDHDPAVPAGRSSA